MVNSGGNRKKKTLPPSTANGLVNGSAKLVNGHSKVDEVNGLPSRNRGDTGSDRDSVCSVPTRRRSYRDAASSPLLPIPNNESPLADIPDMTLPETNGDMAPLVEERETIQPSTSNSVHSQTDSSAPHSDGLLSYLALSEWDQTETLCEMIAVLSPYQLRLVAACVEGAARSAQTIPMHQHEVRANSPQFIQGLPGNMGGLTYPDTLECAFTMVCLLSSTNRAGAFAFVKLIDQLMLDRLSQLPLLTDEHRHKSILVLGKLVSSALHHPAFSVDQRIRLSQARDELRNQLNSISETTTKLAETQRDSSNPAPLLFIRRFKAMLSEANNPDRFLIELVWNDGECTWVNRSRDDIASIHHRLLDLFGEERREQKDAAADDTDLSIASSEFETAESIPASPTPTTVTSSQFRILPYFSRDAPPQAVIEYVNGLSDLPARMMLSSVVYEEFYSSRQNTQVGEQLLVDEETRPSSRSSPVLSSCHKFPATATPTFPIAYNPLSYGPFANMQGLQLNMPTCSNCAGQHAFVMCDKKNIMDITQNGKDGFRVKTSDSSPSQCSSNETSVPPPRMFPSMTAPPPGLGGMPMAHGTTVMYADGQQGFVYAPVSMMLPFPPQQPPQHHQ